LDTGVGNICGSPEKEGNIHIDAVTIGEPAISVAQKTAGYKAGTLDFTPDLLRAIDFVDNALGQIVAKLIKKKIYNKTLFIIASKHGQTS
jgi:predicted AlkP superfamily pyrophosphatase or phosphodiesterase